MRVNTPNNGTATTIGGELATLTATADANDVVSSVQLKGPLSPGFVGNNVISLPGLVPYTQLSPTLLGEQMQVDLSATRKVSTIPSSLDRLDFTGLINVLKAGSVDSTLAFDSGSYVQSANLESSLVQDGTDQGQLKLRAETPLSKLTGTLIIDSFKKDASGLNYAPTHVKFAGAVFNRAKQTDVFAEFLSGSIDAYDLNKAARNPADPASNVVQGKVNLAGRVTIPTRPTLDVTLNTKFSQPSGGITPWSANFVGQYLQGSSVFNLDGTDRPPVKTFKLSTTDGLSMTVDSTKSAYDILDPSGHKLGIYDSATQRISYIDGTYAQF